MGFAQTVQHFFDQVSHRAANENKVVKFRAKTSRTDNVAYLQNLENKEIDCCVAATD